MNNGTLISVRTKYGHEIHAGKVGSSVTLCGHWMKVTGARMQVQALVTCEKCKKQLAWQECFHPLTTYWKVLKV